MELDLKEVGCKDVDWIDVPQAKVQWWAFVNMVTPLGYIKSRVFLY
jgi:hypothetical protein